MINVIDQVKYLLHWRRTVLNHDCFVSPPCLLRCANCNDLSFKLALKLRWLSSYGCGHEKELKSFLDSCLVKPLFVEIGNLDATQFHEHGEYVECYVSPDLTDESEIWRVC